MMIVGAAAVVIGSVLPWFTLRVDTSSFGGAGVRNATADGLDTSHGPIFIVIAVVVAALGAVAVVTAARGTRTGVSIVAALGALVVLAIAIHDAATPKSALLDEVSREIGAAGAAAVRRFIEGMFDRGVVQIDVEAGLVVVIVGAAVALIGSVLAAATAASAPAEPAAGPVSGSTAAAGTASIPPIPPATPPVRDAPASTTGTGAVPGMTTTGAATPTPPPESPPGPVREDSDPSG
jgi:hypothetical protein